jgi:hypothetical protein
VQAEARLAEPEPRELRQVLDGRMLGYPLLPVAMEPTIRSG